MLGELLCGVRDPIVLKMPMGCERSLCLLLTSLFWVGVWFPGFAWAEDSTPIKVRALFQLIGRAAEHGRHGSQGAKMAEKEINERGGILGRKLEVLLTHEGTATAEQGTRRYIFEDQVDFLVGVDVSSVALAVSAEAARQKKIVLFTHAPASRLTGRSCHRYTFRLVPNAVMDARAGAFVFTDKPAERWYGIVENSEYGRDSWGAFQAAIRKVKPDVVVVGESWPEPFASDYAPVIQETVQAMPDAVWSTLWGGDLVAFVREARSVNFFERVKFFANPGGASLSVLAALGDEMPGGLWVSTPYWFLHPDSVSNEVFVRAYRSLYGEYPADVAMSTYSAIHLLKQVIEEAGSLDPDGIVGKLEGMTYRDPEGLKTIRREDHQAIKDVIWGRTTSSDEYPFRVLDDLVVVPGEKIVGSVEETGCEMWEKSAYLIVGRRGNDR